MNIGYNLTVCHQGPFPVSARAVNSTGANGVEETKIKVTFRPQEDGGCGTAGITLRRQEGGGMGDGRRAVAWAVEQGMGAPAQIEGEGNRRHGLQEEDALLEDDRPRPHVDAKRALATRRVAAARPRAEVRPL